MNNVYSLHHAISFRYCSVHSSQIRADYPINLEYSATIRNFAVKNIYNETGNQSQRDKSGHRFRAVDEIAYADGDAHESI